MGWFSTLLTTSQQGPAAGPLPAEYGYEWALVDVETTGLRSGQHRVVQVAVITLDPDGRQTDEYSTLLNPGCDPGPTHIHGITAAHLHGAPTFDEVAPRLAGLLEGRTLVAHNASFDYDFLRHEFIRAGSVLPVQRRLCTLALNRRLGTPAPDMRLGTLAAHYRVPQQRAHDALDDTRVLAGILRASLHAAAPLGLGLPMVTCPPKGQGGGVTYTPNIPKVTCAFASPGRWTPGTPLVQGMKVALTGDTALAREELVGRGARAGLNMMNNVSRHTSVLVTNDVSSGSAKADRARQENVPVIDEAQFVALLGAVSPGVPLEQAAPPVPAQRTSPAAARPALQPASSAVLTGRRVLVLGDDHAATSAARAALVELGAAAAVNLSGNVTDVLCLAHADQDKRWTRILALGLPLRPPQWLTDPSSDVQHRPSDAPDSAATPALATEAASNGSEQPTVDRELASTSTPSLLARGQVIDLPSTGLWTIAASWAASASTEQPGATPPSTVELDIVAFTLDQTEQVTGDDDMTFFNNPVSHNGAVTLTSDGPNEQTVTVDLDALPGWAQRVTVAAAIDHDTATFSDVGAVALSIGPGGDAPVYAEATLDAATVERTLSLLELYRRGDGWRIRAIGQGWTSGLADLAVLHGVDIDDAD